MSCSELTNHLASFFLNCQTVFAWQGSELPLLLHDNSFRSDLVRQELNMHFKREPEENPVIPSTMATPPPEQPIPQPLIVSNTDFPGGYGFDLGFAEEKGPLTKSVQWTYSPSLKKLFVKMRCIVPLRFKLQG